MHVIICIYFYVYVIVEEMSQERLSQLSKVSQPVKAGS